MPAPPRSFSVTYNGVTVGSTAARRITAERSPFVFEEDEQVGEFRLEFDLVIRAADEAAFKTDLATVATAFRTPFADLTVTMGDGTTSSDYFEFTADGSSGRLYLDPLTTFSKPGSTEHDTARSGLFHFALVAGLPQDQRTADGSSGYRNAKVAVLEQKSGRRTVTVTGEYTAVGTADARTTLSSNIATRATAICTAIGGANSNWDLVDKTESDVDDSRDGTDAGMGSVVRFLYQYREKMVAEPGADFGGLLGSSNLFTNRDLVDPFWQIEVEDVAPLSDLSRRKFSTATITFETDVDFERVSGLAALKDLYNDTIKPFLVSEAETLLGTSASGTVLNRPAYDSQNNRITATVQVQAAVLGGLPLGIRVVIQDTEKPGEFFIAAAVPNPYAKFQYQGPGEYKRRITITTATFDIARGRPLPNRRRFPAQAGRITNLDDFSAEREALGERGDSLQLITAIQLVEFEYGNPIGPAGEAPIRPVGEPLSAVPEFFGPEPPTVGLGSPARPLGLPGPPVNIPGLGGRAPARIGI